MVPIRNCFLEVSFLMKQFKVLQFQSISKSSGCQHNYKEFQLAKSILFLSSIELSQAKTNFDETMKIFQSIENRFKKNQNENERKSN